MPIETKTYKHYWKDRKWWQDEEYVEFPVLTYKKHYTRTKTVERKIKSLLRRGKPYVVSDEASYLDLRIDRESMKVFRKEKEITLGPKEYKLLNFLIKQPKRVYSRDQLLEHVWGDDINVESRTVDVHITRLRQAINIEGTKPLIRTVRSAGYSLEN